MNFDKLISVPSAIVLVINLLGILYSFRYIKKRIIIYRKESPETMGSTKFWVLAPFSIVLFLISTAVLILEILPDSWFHDPKFKTYLYVVGYSFGATIIIYMIFLLLVLGHFIIRTTRKYKRGIVD